jgi:tryptophan-rich sensory protein
MINSYAHHINKLKDVYSCHHHHHHHYHSGHSTGVLLQIIFLYNNIYDLIIKVFFHYNIFFIYNKQEYYLKKANYYIYKKRMSILFWELFMLLLIFIYSQFSRDNRGFNRRYAKLKKIYIKNVDNSCHIWPDGAIFGIVWVILYALIFSAFMAFMWNLAPDNNTLNHDTYFNIWDATMTLFIFNIILNKLWCSLFIDGSAESIDYVIDKSEKQNTQMNIQPKISYFSTDTKKSSSSNPSTSPLLFGIIIMILLIISAIIICVLTALQKQWVTFGLYIPYILWLIYAMSLNISIFSFVKKMIK